jgi:hypothetical protein
VVLEWVETSHPLMDLVRRNEERSAQLARTMYW